MIASAKKKPKPKKAPPPPPVQRGGVGNFFRPPGGPIKVAQRVGILILALVEVPEAQILVPKSKLRIVVDGSLAQLVHQRPPRIA